MNELLEYKNMFLNYPRTNIKEMANLLKQRQNNFISGKVDNAPVNLYLFQWSLVTLSSDNSKDSKIASIDPTQRYVTEDIINFNRVIY